MNKSKQRLDRQFDLIVRRFPQLGGLMRFLRADYSRVIRLPMGLLFLVGGLFAVLPFLGLWMIPVGLMLLAVDIPFLRGPVARLVIRGRRWAGRWARPQR
jgi:hypothetical protein